MAVHLALLWNALHADQRAVTALEYGLVASLVAVVITMAADMMGHHLARAFNTIASNL
jgi:Flp pilus assembly pilin Flp